MQGHGRRGLLSLALAVLIGTSACGGDDASPKPTPTASRSVAVVAPTPSPPPAPVPQVTLTEAGRVLAGIISADGVLGAATPHLDADRKNILEQTRDGQEALTAAAFSSSADALPHYTWGAPDLLVPRVQGSAPWFAAIVRREDSAGKARSAVLTVIRQGRDDWRLSSTSLLDVGTRAPAIVKDADGYATALGEEDTTVEISPRLMAPLHATSAEEGAQGFAAGLIEEGPHTTGYADEIAEKRPAEKNACLGYDSIFAASDYPVHALRTADGGALVLYSLIRTTTQTVKVEPCASDFRIPPDVAKLTSDSFVREELRTVETQLYVSTVPAKNSGGPAKVIGYLGGITKVTVS
ncbi:hypothetical protein [Streptosporangium sp. 'caverna']|uniref:hypothetical protein n=1 Tax=Streptosporangium sp. 'caverna' TaxID=2202249 RepID=UPI0013A6A6C5|nr:hypothetical protein [Streptosporangium sp. 'caverna']